MEGAAIELIRGAINRMGALERRPNKRALGGVAAADTRAVRSIKSMGVNAT